MSIVRHLTGKEIHNIEGDYFISTVNTPGHHGSLIRFNPFNPSMPSNPIPNNGSVHVGVTMFANPWLQRTDGKPFTLVFLEIGEYSQSTNRQRTVPVVGLKADGTDITTIFRMGSFF